MSVQLSAVNQIDCQIIPGFSGYYQRGGILPVTALVRNNGHEVECTAVLTTFQGSIFGEKKKLQSTRDIVLPKNSYKRIYLEIPAEGVSQPCTFTLESGGTVLFSEDIDLRNAAMSAELVLVLSRNHSLDFILPILNDVSESKVQIIYPHAAFLPECESGYRDIKGIIIHNAILKDLNEVQVNALMNWVYAGGRIMFVGGKHSAPRFYQPVVDLLPVSPVGLVDVPSEEFSISGENVLMVRTDPLSSTVLEWKGGYPFLVKKKVGAGSTWFLATDPSKSPLNLLEHREEYFFPILELLKNDDTDEVRFSGIPLQDTLSRLSIFNSIHRQWFLLLGLVYISLYFILTLIRKLSIQEWLHIIIIPLLCVLLGTGTVFLFTSYLQNPEGFLLDLGAEYSSGTGKAFFRREIYLGSIFPESYSYTVPTGTLEVNSPDAESLDIHYFPRGERKIGDIELSRWEFSSFVLRGTGPERLTVGKVTGDRADIYQVKNHAEETVYNGILVVSGVPYLLGTLEPQSIVEKEVSRLGGRGLSKAELGDFLYGSLGADDNFSRALIHGLFQQEFSSQTQDDTIILIGFINGSPSIPEPLPQTIYGKLILYYEIPVALVREE